MEDESRSTTYLGLAAVLLAAWIAVDLPLALWAETGPHPRIWTSPAFLAPFIVFCGAAVAGVVCVAGLFTPLPLPKLLHERRAEERAAVRVLLGSVFWEGQCLANDPNLTREASGEWMQKAIDFVGGAFGPQEGTALMATMLRYKNESEPPTRYEAVEVYLERLTQIIDRSHELPITPGFTPKFWEESQDTKCQLRRLDSERGDER